MSQAIHYINKKPASIPEQAIDIVMSEVLDKANLLKALDKALSFPNYFAHNWDSAWDCLTDSGAKHLRLDLTDVKQINTEDFNVFKSVIEDAFRDFGQPQLWVVGLNVDE
nr:barstar family protein [uncultured Psychrobacter sp.]